MRATRQFTKAQRQRLWRDLQYLNLAEMRSFCQRHELPLHIHVELEGGRLRRTGDRDRKDIVLARILEFALHGRRTGPTIYRREVVATAALPPRLDRRTRLRYGQYEKHNRELLQQLQALTGGAFRFGMIARLVLRDAWTAGTAPTLQQFAASWMAATAAHTRPRPEGAYLVDLWQGQVGPGWKQLRRQRAKAALATLAGLVRR